MPREARWVSRCRGCWSSCEESRRLGNGRVFRVGKQPHAPNRASGGAENVWHAEDEGIDRVVAESRVVDAAAKLTHVRFLQLKQVDSVRDVTGQKKVQVGLDRLEFNVWL